jgi:hypothetical protein
LSVDELWTLYTDVDQILAARIVVKKKELERRFDPPSKRRQLMRSVRPS